MREQRTDNRQSDNRRQNTENRLSEDRTQILRAQITKKSGFWTLSLVICALCSTLCVLLLPIAAYSQGLVIMAKKVSGELPSDPGDGMWKTATAISVPLAPQVMAKPRIYESKIKELRVRALHNIKDIAFLVDWDDPTEDSIVDIDKFSDAIALEFPSQSAKEKPHFAMGDKENTVNI